MEKKYKILVVDDETSIRNLCKRSLKTITDDIELVDSAEKASVIIKEKKFDVILLDVMLPGQQGNDFLKEIRNVSPDTSVIMITGKPDVTMAVETLKNGALDYLVKPFEINELREIVSKALSNGKLLIADDDEGVVKAICKIMIKEFPHIDIVVEDSEESIKRIINKFNISIVIMDVNLKSFNGLKLTDDLLNEGILSPEKIIIITGYPSKEIEEEVKNLGITSYLVKPFFMEELVDIISEKLKL